MTCAPDFPPIYAGFAYSATLQFLDADEQEVDATGWDATMEFGGQTFPLVAENTGTPSVPLNLRGVFALNLSSSTTAALTEGTYEFTVSLSNASFPDNSPLLWLTGRINVK